MVSVVRKPKRWVEHLSISLNADVEHRWYIESRGFEDYLKNRIWELPDEEVGQLNHPGVVYGLIYAPQVEASSVAQIL